VVATANHWWLDGVVAIGIVAVAVGVQIGIRAAWRALRSRAAVSTPGAVVDEDQVSVT
jgi:hypothetical protein